MIKPIIAFLILALAFSCGGSSSSTTGASSSSSLTFETQSLTIHKMAGGSLNLTVEVADNDEKRTQGLMNRQSLDSDAGMLFIFDSAESLSFWMKDTFVSLDIIFMDSQKQIVFIEENTTPLSLDRIAPGVSSQYVLEVNAGYVAQNGVNVGDTMTF